MTEASARIQIDKLLLDANWVLPGGEGDINVETETRNDAGFADYVLKDSSDFPLAVIEAKRELINPLTGKEQARGYADSLNCRFVLLSNGVTHYFWDIQQGSPTLIDAFPTQEQLELRKAKFNPTRDEKEEIEHDYIALTQMPGFKKHPEYLDENSRDEFLQKNKLRLVREYQLNAVKSVQSGVSDGKDRFLLEMATGTGKTLTSSAIIKMFLRLFGVKRVLFLVDRIELETQAKKEFDEILSNDFRTVVWKENQSDWTKAEIVVSTVQSLVSRNKYQKVFKPDHFDLVISDEAHRSLGARSRKVFEYFIGFKLGLTATPRDYLKSVNLEEIGALDPRQLEERLMRDTYTTFGCEGGQPTFRYSLEDGVKDKFLINPVVIDARTEITTELLSEQGFVYEGVDEEGNDVEETFGKRDFEKKFFSENTNRIFCETFLQKAKRDPFTNEIGKTLIFCVSQNHATKVTQILNSLADVVFPQRYNSDFAVQVTSQVENAQRMTIDFRNNSLNGQSKFNPYYRSSKTRVCVTVGMMTTGYDCTDILNICMMRPIFSPSDFIQMKGRGTRKHDFQFGWISKSEMPDEIDSNKTDFVLFDFFGNYEYFEKDYDYDEVLQLPTAPSDRGDDPVKPRNVDEYENINPDPLKELKEIILSEKGMKIDRNLYRTFKKTVSQDPVIKDLVMKQDFVVAEEYLREKVLDKPQEFFTLEKLRKSLGIDRNVTIPELLLHVFGHINHIPSRRECIEEEFDKFEKTITPPEDNYSDAKRYFEAYSTDKNYRDIIDSGKLADLRVHTSGEVFFALPADLRKNIPQFVKENVDLKRLENVG